MLGILIFYHFTTSVKVELRYAEKDLKFEIADGFTKVRIERLEITAIPGEPELPVQTLKIAIPYGARIKDLKIKDISSTTFPEKYELSWAQPPAILSMRRLPKRIGRKEEIYNQDKLYPPGIIEFKGTGVFDNQQICEIAVFPLQYRPALKELIFHNKIQLCVEYEGGINLPAKKEVTKKLVINPEDIMTAEKARGRDYFQYLIITNPPMDTIFQRLADWKTKKGIPARVRTTNWLYSHYPGEDNAAKIRNYLKTLPDSNVEYVLLGGDIDFIPCRFAYAMDCSAGYWPGREDTMPCDLYYADLQGDWDLDDDGSYGEIEDSIDLYPDLFVGRAPVNTIAEAQKFVEKVLIYEKNPELDYLNNALFAAEILWSDPYTDQGVHKNKIEGESFSSDFQLTKLYQSLGNETREAVMQAIRDGQGLINHDGHGWIDLISVGGWPHRIYATDFDTMTNSPRYGILYSIGCWTGAFDFSSISEAFVNSPQGGGVAYIGNSSYGWGSPGNPGFGYSDRFDSRFFYSLLKEDNFHLGVALSLAKAHFIPYSREKNVYRWHQYQLNLLGDPELPVWTEIPETLSVAHPQSIPLGNAQILITVKDRQTQSPIKDALVCLMKQNESYASGYTDASGSIFLAVNPQTTGNFDLTVSGHNYLPFETTIPVVSGSYVNFNRWLINDIFGNNDQIPNPGESILLTTIIKNCGNVNANNIQLVLYSSDPNVSIPDSIATVPALAPGDSALIENAFAIIIDTVPDHYCLPFDLKITDNNQTIHFFPNLLAGTPVLKIHLVEVANPPALPGAVESLYIAIKNLGLGIGHSVRGHLSSLDPYLFILIDSLRYGEISPESISIPTEPFVVYVSPFSPGAHLAELLLQLKTEDYNFLDTFKLLIGKTGFHDDMEAGDSLWTSGGTNNLWHISPRRSFSPTHSWYCGNETSGQYVNNMNCYIQSVPFMVGENSRLRFYRWFSVPLYGADGIYVIVLHNGNADTIDFIGTGGALKGRGIQSDWFEESYSLNQYPVGDTIQLRIAFISDNDGAIGEGFYIDNVNVEYVTSIEDMANQKRELLPHLAIFPNPFRNHLVIQYALSTMDYAPPNHKVPSTYSIVPTIRIYDVAGRLVKDLSRLTVNGKRSTIIWDGSDDLGRRLPAGVYFVRLEAGEFSEIEGAVFLR